MPPAIALALVGVGKIARDQHLPAIAAGDDFVVRATVDRSGHALDGVPAHASVAALLADAPFIEAVAFCSPAAGRRADVEAVLRAGRHVLVEKPPVAALAELEPLRRTAAASGATLFAAWHSRFGLAVEPARALLADTALHAVSVDWREDVRHWHPGQDWLWAPAGLGVFDPGVNALAILTAILPRPFALQRATLAVPANRAAPIAARLHLVDTDAVPIDVALDFRHVEPRIWTIRLDTGRGAFLLTEGGHRLRPVDVRSADAASAHATSTDASSADPAPFPGLSPHEYPALYRHFAALIRSKRSDADLAPLVHAFDALTLGDRVSVEPFHHGRDD